MLLPLLSGIERGFGGQELRRLPIFYTQFFQTLWLRLIIFFSCLSVFSQLFRSEFLEKTLHHYCLVPIRREAIVLGKYLTMLLAIVILFSTSTALTYFLFFWPSASGRDFLLTGLGISHMFHYVAIAVLACAAYGALFLLIGLTFRNPMIPALFVLCWETFNYTMPSLFQHVSVILYLQSFMPVTLLGGPFAIAVEPPVPVVSAAILIVVSAMIVMVCGYLVKRIQITYSAE
jgi:ABC-type transport system involved in multi-copper enzyme maturation permease subunit